MHGPVNIICNVPSCLYETCLINKSGASHFNLECTYFPYVAWCFHLLPVDYFGVLCHNSSCTAQVSMTGQQNHAGTVRWLEFTSSSITKMPVAMWDCTEWHTFYTRSTRSLFLTWLSRRVRSIRWSSFGKRVWFTESHIVLVISFFFLFYLLISFLIQKKRAVSS